MDDFPVKLMTAVDAEAELGSKYFYRQRTYRYQKSGKLKAFSFRGQQCFLPHKLLEVYINELRARILTTAPELKDANVFFDDGNKRMVVDGIDGKYVEAKTDLETEEDLLAKLVVVKEWLIAKSERPPVKDASVAGGVATPTTVEKGVTAPVDTGLAPGIFPTDIQVVKIETGLIEGVEVKSYILMSLPSIANFIGVRSDAFARWVQKTSFSKFVLSIHSRKIDGPQISGSFKKGFEQGYTPLLPLELVPELLVTFRQSGLTAGYPARAEQLYGLASSTLEAVGLAISGNGDKAATELARVSEGLGISTADQVLALFKRYESKQFQVTENKRFRGKIRAVGQDYRVVTSEITVGVTGMYPHEWLALGKQEQLPAKERTTGREVMRHIKPEESVGITFSESHYIKDHSNMDEVIETGLQGKMFYKRLKDVGLLDD